MTLHPPQPTVPALAVPGYRLLGRCWEDASTVTFAGEDASSGSPVFIKILKNHAADPAGREALRRDHDVARRIDLDGLVKPLVWGTSGRSDFLVLPDDGTRPIEELLLEGKFDLLTSLELLAGLGRTLGMLHGRHIVHANVTASSVWFSKRSQKVRIADFSRVIHLGDGSLPQEPSLPTDLHYMAPEQTGRVGDAVDGRLDLYAVGALAYYLVCGNPPFQGSSPVDLLHAHLARLPTPPRMVHGEIPEVVSDIIVKLLSKSPEDRYQTAEALQFDLREVAAQLRSRGRIEPMPLGKRDASAGFRISERLYHREAERLVLRSALDRVVQGAREAVFIAGAPGIGKSLLVRSIEAEASARGAFGSGKFDQLKESEPYSVVIKGLRDVVDGILAEDEATVRTLRERLVAAVGVNGAVIANVIPEVELIIGPQPSVQELPPAEKRNRFNQVFRRFVRALARQDHPLFIFLDDLQWADRASLGLLRTLLTDSRASHFLVIGTYRDTELRQDSELAHTLGSLRTCGITVSEVRLAPLDVEHVAELLSDTLHCSLAETYELATHVVRKTDGNPFFIKQLLLFLHRSRLFTFDFDRQRWSWEIQAVAAQGVTDDILQLMMRKLTILPALTQDALKAAACLGLQFSLQELALVMDQDPSFLTSVLSGPERDGLIIRVPSESSVIRQLEGASDGERAQQPEFQFLHDRVQQAAYALIPVDQRRPMRLNIGRKLLDRLPAGEKDAIPFVVLDNLNEGVELLSDPAERRVLAELNLAAGRRARERAAYDAALGYFRSGMRLLSQDCWLTQYELTLALHFERFECAYVTGNGDEANDLFRQVLQHAQTTMEKSKAYYLKVLLSSGLDRSDEAVALGLEGLKLLDERLPAAPNRLDLFRELARALYLLRGRPAQALISLPRMADPHRRAVISLLMAICPAAYFRNPDLMSLAALRIVSMSLKHGHTSASPFGYVLFGLIRGALFGDYKGGHEFGRLAVDMADREGLISQRCKILMIFAGFINFWRQPIDTSVEILRTSFQLALDCGDVQYANYSILQILFLRLAHGDDLAEIEQDCGRYEPFIEQSSDWFALSSSRVRRQCVLALKNCTAHGSSLTDRHYDEEAAVAAFKKAGNLTAWSYYLIVKMQLTFLFDEMDQARGYSDTSEAQIKSVLNQIVVAEHYFYRGLISAALLRRRPQDRGLWRALNRSRAKLRKWARNCPENFTPHHLLIEGEFTSLRGLAREPGRCYDAATAAAQKHNFRHIEALANELAGVFYLASGRDNIARAYLQAARKAYASWGASAKVEQITQKYEALFRAEDAEPLVCPPIPSAHSGSVREFLDADIMMRASSGAHQGVPPDRLLPRLIQLVLEGTGGERASFIVTHDGGLRVAVAGSTHGLPWRPEGSSIPHAGGTFSERVVMYVLRTGNRLVLLEPRSDVRFASCAHIRERQPRSIVCVPLLKKGEVLGVAYIEDVPRAGGFNPDRLNSLMLLSHQAALVLENERLGRDLRDNSASLQSALTNLELLQCIREHLTKFVPASLQQLIENNPHHPDLEGRTEDLSILFLDMAGYTHMSEELSATELKTLVETYFSSFLDVVRRNQGEINEVAGDGLMIVFQDRDSNEHARRAVRTALAIRHKASEMNGAEHHRWPAVVINIGIHSGESLIGANKIQSATGTLWIYTVTGYAANVASRIGASATDGAILVSDDTALRLGQEFDLASTGPQVFKGISRPIEVFRVDGHGPEQRPPQR